MFDVYENTYMAGEKIPTVKVVASKPKKHQAESLARKLNQKQDHIKPEDGLRCYYVRTKTT